MSFVLLILLHETATPDHNAATNRRLITHTSPIRANAVIRRLIVNALIVGRGIWGASKGRISRSARNLGTACGTAKAFGPSSIRNGTTFASSSKSSCYCPSSAAGATTEAGAQRRRASKRRGRVRARNPGKAGTNLSRWPKQRAHPGTLARFVTAAS